MQLQKEMSFTIIAMWKKATEFIRKVMPIEENKKWANLVHIYMKMNIKHVKRHERRHLQYANRINWINYTPPVRRMIENGHGIQPKNYYSDLI